MTHKEKIAKTISFAKKCFENDFSGHDWWHTFRVWKIAKNIAKKEKADIFKVEMAALLHDVGDRKLNGGNEKAGKNRVINWLKLLEIDEKEIEEIWDIVESVSFRGAGTKTTPKTLEGMVVQDADRLDAIGAIGIARAFAYGGSQGRDIYDPNIKPVLHKNYEEYKKHKGTSVNHFYEKLLLLKDELNTKTAKEIAQKRHEYIVGFLDEFLSEWEGKR